MDKNFKITSCYIETLLQIVPFRLKRDRNWIRLNAIKCNIHEIIVDTKAEFLNREFTDRFPRQ